MNILFVNSIGASIYGGGEKWMITAASGLSERGHRVWLGCRPESVLASKAGEAGVQILPLPVAGDFNPLLVGKLIRFVKKNRIHLIIPNLMKDIRTAGLAGRLTQTPVLARQGLVLCKNHWKYKLGFQWFTNGILVNSRGIKETYQSRGWFNDDFYHIIANGVKIPQENKLQILQNEPPLILSAGRLDRQKGFDVLIESAVHAQRDKQNWQFIIAGKGEERPVLEGLIQKHELENVRLIGFQTDLTAWLNRCCLFVLPSRFEGMPNVVMEAMAAGRAVVASDLPGTRELIVPDKTGLLVEPGSSIAFYQGIYRLIESPSLNKTLAEAGRHRIKTCFSIPMMLDKLETLFQETVS